MTMTNPVTQVYVTTQGLEHVIESVWLTLEEAKEAAGKYGSVEVWPIGDGTRTLGSFYRGGDFDATTGEPSNEYNNNDADLLDETEDERVRVMCWPERFHPSANKIGIRVSAETKERADKVYSEVRARVLADISMELPKEAIATHQMIGGTWTRTRGTWLGENFYPGPERGEGV